MTGCVILASGEGRRFGGNKLMADLRGKPLVLHVIEASEGLFDRSVLVTRSNEVAVLGEDCVGLSVVLHGEPLKSDSVRLGLEKLLNMEKGSGSAENAGGALESVMFFQGDQPLVRKSSIERMLGEASEYPDAIIRLSFGGEAGAPVLFPRWAFPELLSLPEGKGGGAVIGRHPETVRLVEAEDASELRDADTPEELLKLITPTS